MSSCCFCGHSTNADVDHFHGVTAQVCKYNSCKSDWQNFKIRLEKYKKSPFPDVANFAHRVEIEVFDNNKPAIEWNRQLMSVRKLQKKFPMITNK